ncbi:MAG: hypothetical protein M1828_007073 [Chrysothrix sp. TS-e1954]|nr:MAG: hypothetical protein M1828_007073 [Chrysothrix sp. TS-e1954]
MDNHTLPRRNPPFRAEHLGSLLRPQDLLTKRSDVDDGKANETALGPAEDDAIATIVKHQLDLGFHAVSDGEYRRHMFWGTFFPTLNGMKEIFKPDIGIFRTYMPDIAAFTEANEKPGESVICVGKISHMGNSVNLPQYEYMKKILPRERWGDVKMTLPAPEWYHMRYREGQAYPADVYTKDADYFQDIAVAYRHELKILYDAGLRNVQIDDPNMAYFCSESMLSGWAEDKANKRTADELLNDYIAFYNDCISQRPSDMHIGIHICRGNFVNSRHFSEGGYDRIAAKLFRDLQVDTFYLEFDTPRAGGFEPLRKLPRSKNVILGVITSKFPELEDKEAMKARVYQAADFVAKGSNQSQQAALQRLGVSPQCGFASHAKGNLLGYDDMLQKLKLVRQIAEEVWPGEP